MSFSIELTRILQYESDIANALFEVAIATTKTQESSLFIDTLY